MPDHARLRTPTASPGRTLVRLKAAVQTSAENRPGVYRMLGPAGQVLYVGKSVRVRGRLLSYFRADPGEKAAEILDLTERIEWDHHPSEFAALLQEFREIRVVRPPFNRQHKKERSVCFIRFTRGPAPRVLATTRVVADRSQYLGPLLGIDRVRAAVRVLVDALELRDCPATTPLRFADQGDLFGADPVPRCSRADFGRCLAPCAAGCDERTYARRVDVARAFLMGETDEPLERLQRHLDRAVRRWLFEYAAVVASRIELLRGVRASLLRLRRSLDSLTGVYHVPGHDGQDRVYVLQRGLVRADVPAPRTRADRRVFQRAVQRHSDPLPLTRIGPDGLAEMLLVERWFRRNPVERDRLRSP